MAKRDKPGVRPPRPIDPYGIIRRLVLSAPKAAELCGISRRQLCYWTEKGIVRALGHDSPERPSARRYYGFAALCRALLIRREMDRGNSLHRAVALVDRQARVQAQRQREILDSAGPQRQEFLLAQASRLAGIADQLRNVLQRKLGEERLRALVDALRRVAPETEGGGDVADLLAEPEACHGLATALDQAEAVIDDIDLSGAG